MNPNSFEALGDSKPGCMNAAMQRIEGLAGGFATAAVGAIPVVPYEVIRSELVNPGSGFSPNYKLDESGNLVLDSEGNRIVTDEPVLTQEETPVLVYEALQYSGDIIDGYFRSAVAFGLISVVLMNKLSRSTRLWGTAALISSLGALYELGIINEQKPDPADIPAVVIGAFGFAAFYSRFKDKISPYMSQVN